MSGIVSTLKQNVGSNRQHFTWKYWVILTVWEVAAFAIAVASVVGGSTPLDASFLFWASLWIVLPVLPVVIPMATQQRIGSTLAKWFLGLIVVAGLWIIGGYFAEWLFPDQDWAYQWRYSTEDNMTGAVISVDHVPHDCEFLTAPLGTKHCHYDKRVATVRVRANGGQRSASFDEGRSWVPADDSTHAAVIVTWERVAE